MFLQTPITKLAFFLPCVYCSEYERRSLYRRRFCRRKQQNDSLLRPQANGGHCRWLSAPKHKEMVGWIEGTTTGRKLGRTVTKLAQVQHRAKKDQIEVTLSHEYVNTYDGSLDPCRTYLLAFFDSTIERCCR